MTRFVAILLAALALAACSPMLVQHASQPPQGFSGPRVEGEHLVSFDGARLGLRTWDAPGEPWAVIVGLHGMNDHSMAFHLAGPWWAERGVTTWAYDQRGFGRSPQRGIWAGQELMIEDLRTVVAVARQRYPNALIVVAGESMGGAVAAAAFASDRPPAADRLVLLAPAVWGWREQPLPNRTLLWFAANVTPGKVYTPPRWLTRKIVASDNREELIRMGRDPLMIWGARSDTIFGLVNLMDQAADAMPNLQVPTFYLYGAKDQIIPEKAAERAATRLRPSHRTAYYARGYHLLTRDRQAPVVWEDVLAFVRDPQGPLPSAAPTIRERDTQTARQSSAGRTSAGL